MTATEENTGLSSSERGMYRYPEQFVSASELVEYGALPPDLRVRTGPLSDPEVTV